MLMAAGVKLPDTIFLHGFFTVDGQKMSKSLGNMIDPNDMAAEFGPDGTRYLLLTQYPFGVDGDIQAKRFAEQYNSDLANDLGNLVSRVAKLIQTNFDGALPEPSRDVEGLQELMEQAEALPGAAHAHVTHFELGQAIAEAMRLVRVTNKFFNDRAPWVLAREGKRAALGGVLYACCEVVRITSIILFPIMPDKIRQLRAVFGLDDTTLTLDNARTFFDLKPGTKIVLEDALFPRLAAAKPQPGSGTPQEDIADGVGTLMDISEFARVDMRVAQVLEAGKVEGADKLLKLRIDIGSEKRQIVAGIAQHYTPEQMTGMKIIVVTNLKPAKIRGIESNGMLLAATSGKKLCLLIPDGDLPPGAKVS
jgi:methionyl-tRNA synthetase